jgi:hypothetical protein
MAGSRGVDNGRIIAHRGPHRPLRRRASAARAFLSLAQLPGDAATG